MSLAATQEPAPCVTGMSLAAVSGFQAPVPHFCSPVAPGASEGDARAARG